VEGDTRTVLRLHPRLAPYKVAVLPLSKKPELVEPAERLADELRKRWMVELDVTQSIGRRYRRQDEIGTPFCVTIDFDTLDDGAATIRDRDSMAQDRVSMGGIADYLAERLV
jgi:glycyl-tRNA synthetase